jgi:SSS family solute:Na+ symporter
MPYIALQLLGLGSLLTVLGVPSHGLAGDVALTATFAVLAVGTYRYGLEAPSRIAVIKGLLVFGSMAVAVPVVFARLGGPEGVAEAAGPALERRTSGAGGLLLDPGLTSAYASLAVGSALALLLYPHVLVCAFAARDADVVRRATPWLLVWTALLGVVATLGLAASAAGVDTPGGHAELALPLLLRDALPSVLAGVVLGAVGIAALVPAAIMSVASGAMFASNIYVEYIDRTADAQQQARVARAVSLLVKVGAVAFALALPTQDAITLQLLGGVWILQTLPAVVLGLYSRRPHRYAVLAGLAAGLLLGTALVVRDGLVAVTTLSFLGQEVGVYSALVALVVNVVVVVLLTPVLDAARVSRGVDATGVSLRWRGAPPPEWEVTR